MRRKEPLEETKIEEHEEIIYECEGKRVKRVCLKNQAREFEMGCNDDIAFLTRRSFSTGLYTFVGSNSLLPDFKFFSNVYTILEQCTVVLDVHPLLNCNIWCTRNGTNSNYLNR